MVASRFQGLFCEWHPKKPTCKKWKMKKNPKWCSSSFKCHTHNFFQFLRISFLLLKNSRWMMGFLLFRCREFLRCPKKSPLLLSDWWGSRSRLRYTWKESKLHFTFTLCNAFFLCNIIIYFQFRCQGFGGKKWHFIHSNESQLHALKKKVRFFFMISSGSFSSYLAQKNYRALKSPSLRPWPVLLFSRPSRL